MSEDHKKQLEQQLWKIANTLRGKMNADEFRDYILGNGNGSSADGQGVFILDDLSRIE